MPTPDEITVTLPRDEFNEVINLLQLIAVLDVKLYLVGHQPNRALISSAFNLMADQSFAQHIAKESKPCN